LFFLPFLYLVIGFVYRWTSLSRWSATPGMLFFAVQLRCHDGQKLDNTTALLHTLGFCMSFAMVVPQVLSIGMMLTTARRQGLVDTILGTVPMNRATRA